MAGKIDQENVTFHLDEVRDCVSKQFCSGQPSLGVSAQKLRMSPRTLQRRLSEHRLTFTKLADETRFLMARKLIIEHKKMSDIASELGYSDAGSFTRAFERWTGMSPLKYRKQFC